MRRSSRIWAGALAAASLGVMLLVAAGEPVAKTGTQESWLTQAISWTASDGTVLHAALGGYSDSVSDLLSTPKPVILEDSPYAPDVSTLQWAGESYDYVELQWRGTGLSGGSLDSTGALDQHDLSGFLGWACAQGFSDRAIGLYGFSASAIVVYNSMHLALPCVKAAALMSGTNDLYRDLLYIGGIPSPVVGFAVEGMIFAPWMEDLPSRMQQEPSSLPASASGFGSAPVGVGANMTEDSFWQERTYQGDANRFPVFADDGFYDVESRGAFQAYLQTKALGSHLLVMGAHDGSPSNLPGGPFPSYKAWFDHYLLGQNDGVTGNSTDVKPANADTPGVNPTTQPAVDLFLSNGSREQLLSGNWTNVTGADWPPSGTAWSDLYLSAEKSGTVSSLNDGTLSVSPDKASSVQPYPFVPSDPSETDVHTIATVASDGIDQAARYLPSITDMDLSGHDALTYTSAPLSSSVDAVGPVGLDLLVASTQPETDLVAVIADVKPDGTAYPVATGWLRTTYPGIEDSKTLFEPTDETRNGKEVVDPYTDFSSQTMTTPGTTREYHVEVLPIGNQFAKGDRIRLYVLGTPLDMQPSPPGTNVLSIGGGIASARLILPAFDPADPGASGAAFLQALGK